MQAKDIMQIALIAVTLSKKGIIHNFATQIQRVKNSPHCSFIHFTFLCLQIITGNSTNYF